MLEGLLELATFSQENLLVRAFFVLQEIFDLKFYSANISQLAFDEHLHDLFLFIQLCLLLGPFLLVLL
jgi:hypothetical protein